VPFVSLIVENRHGNKSVHGVPEVVMEKMRDRFSFNLNGTVMSNGVLRRQNRINNRLEEPFTLHRATIEL
jgi:hypothetical protein